MVFYR